MSYRRMQMKVGIFSVLALVLLAGATGILASGLFRQNEQDYVLYFEGSVAGLNVGAPVEFRGVPLGRVTSISVVANMRDDVVRIPVGVDIDEKAITRKRGSATVTDELRDAMIQRLVKRGLRARLTMGNLLTGQLRITLDFFPETTAYYVSEDQEREIPTLSSPLEEFSRALSRVQIDKIAEKLMLTLEGMNQILHSEELTGALSGIRHSINLVVELLEGMPQLRDDARRMLGSIDAAAQLVGQEIPQWGNEFQGAWHRLAEAAKKAEQLFASTEKLAAPNSVTMQKVQQALQDLSDAARAIRALATTLERQPESLLRGKGGNRP